MKTAFYTPNVLFANIKSNTKFTFYAKYKQIWTLAFFSRTMFISNLIINVIYSMQTGSFRTVTLNYWLFAWNVNFALESIGSIRSRLLLFSKFPSLFQKLTNSKVIFAKTYYSTSNLTLCLLVIKLRSINETGVLKIKTTVSSFFFIII